jgi:hypothetical protein
MVEEKNTREKFLCHQTCAAFLYISSLFMESENEIMRSCLRLFALPLPRVVHVPSHMAENVSVRLATLRLVVNLHESSFTRHDSFCNNQAKKREIKQALTNTLHAMNCARCSEEEAELLKQSSIALAYIIKSNTRMAPSMVVEREGKVAGNPHLRVKHFRAFSFFYMFWHLFDYRYLF